ncbi:MAG TPA: hypothetical protein VN723_02575 [Rhizomicrobium sp.]|nr:hypothetical protein [Rhizomicrobium sp.]
MNKFSRDLAEFLRRHYPDSNLDGSYRFSADIEIRDGEVTVEIPVLTRMPNSNPLASDELKTGPLVRRELAQYDELHFRVSDEVGISQVVCRKCGTILE